jgi:hypothetical protein
MYICMHACMHSCVCLHSDRMGAMHPMLHGSFVAVQTKTSAVIVPTIHLIGTRANMRTDSGFYADMTA